MKLGIYRWDLLVVLVTACFSETQAAPQVLNNQVFHLRSGDEPEWDEFKHSNPDGAGLVLQFQGRTNRSPATLFITQDNVKQDWRLQLNGRRIGTLFLMEEPLVHTITLPAGLLQDGENSFAIDAPNANDDIRIGRIWLDERPSAEALSEATVEVQVAEEGTGRELPCRITVVDDQGNLAALAVTNDVRLAVRPGVVYTGHGQARIGLPAGKYTIYATRGLEYGVASERVVLGASEIRPVRLQIAREVDTQGMVCADTHIHTGTYARHGDATIDERAVTLAGEGIELPVSTEHDCLVSYSGAANRTGVQDWFTPVIGDEVTTAKGHFNIFPVNFLASLPDKHMTEWPRLMEVFRSTPGLQVVVLNHPRNIHNGFQPFAATNFNAATGENLRGFEFSFDAIEVANSSALQSDWRVSFTDWFALLNYGYRITGVGSSDGHDVSRYIVGQGRTYIKADDRDPARIDVDEVCRNLKQGRATVSLGLFTDLRVNDQFTSGDLATNLSEQVKVTVTVLGPSWVQADHVELFANGVRIREQKWSGQEESGSQGRRGQPLRLVVEWDISRPAHDVHLIALASGPAVRASYWPIARPYQPSSPTWNPRVVGCTNPIWIDADSDGKFTPARAYAKTLVQKHQDDSGALVSALAAFDAAVRTQAESLAQSR